jgi:beta-lactamase class A
MRETTSEALAERLDAILSPSGGRNAVAVRRLAPVVAKRRAGAEEDEAAADAAETIALRMDERFPAASLIKLGVAVELFRRVDLGQFRLDERFDTSGEPRVGGGGALDYLHRETRLTLQDLCFLMLDLSDNTASNFLIELVGLGEINETLARMGLKRTKLARCLMDFEARAAGRDNVTCAGDMVELLALLHRRALPGTPLLRELLLAQQMADDLRAWLPPEAPFACKTGSLDGTGHEDAVFSVAGLLYPPGGGAVALCILTAEQRDPAEARIAVGRALRAVWETWGGE